MTHVNQNNLRRSPSPPPPLRWLFVQISSAGTGRIVAVDVNIPTAPVSHGITYTLAGAASDFQVTMDSRYFFYITNTATSRNVWIFDWASNPAAIIRVGMYTDINRWFVAKALKQGTRLIIPSAITTTSAGSLDISNPATPTLLSELNNGMAAPSSQDGDGCGAIDSSGVFWASFKKGGANGLYSFPTAEPIGPATFRINNSNIDSSTVIVGDYVYVASTAGKVGWNIYKINPFNAALVNQYLLPAACSAPIAPLLRGNYLFVGLNDGGASRRSFQIVDVSDPTTPVFVADSPTIFQRDSSGGSLVVHGNYVYCACRRTGTNQVFLLVFDISIIAAPVLVANLDVSSGQNPTGGSVWGWPNEANQGGNL